MFFLDIVTGFGRPELPDVNKIQNGSSSFGQNELFFEFLLENILIFFIFGIFSRSIVLS